MTPTPASFDSDAVAQPDGLPVPRRYWAIGAVALATAMSVLDSSIANVALPSIARDLHTSNAASIWVINSYQAAILAGILPLAALGEIIGYRRVSQAGLLVFTAASLACAFSSSLLGLTIARVVQGFGAAGIMSVSPALLRFIYPQRLLGRAIGINAFVVAIAAALGPTIASAVLAAGPWSWLFGINVPIGIMAFAIALRCLPATEKTKRVFNGGGALLNAGTFALLVCGLQTLARGTKEGIGVVELVAAAVLGAVLVRHEVRRPAPMIPFDLLRIRVFALSVATSVAAFVAQMAALVALPFEIERTGHSAVAVGLLMTPWPIAVAIAVPIAGRLSDRYPAGLLCAVGLSTLATGLALLAMSPTGGSAVDFVWRIALCGAGFGFFQTPNNRTLLAAAPRSRSGAAGGMLASARLLGQTLGAAGVAIFFRVYAQTGSNSVLWFAAGVALTAAVISLARLPNRGPTPH